MVNNNLKEYENWLVARNLSSETIRVHCWTVKEYEPRELNTIAITDFLKENLIRYEPASLQLFRQALFSYAKFRKIEIEREMINRIIPTVQKKFFTTIDEIELEQLKQAKTKTTLAINKRNNLILDFLFYTGIRVNELVNIRHCDYKNKGLKVLGKGNRARYIFCPDFLLDCFELNRKDFLFTTRRGKKITTTQIRLFISHKTRIAGIKKNITPHTFRRSFATLLNNRKCNLTAIQKFLGHSNLQTTANYIHNSYEELRQEYSKLWNFSPPPSHFNLSLF